MKNEKILDSLKTFLGMIRIRNCLMTFVGVLLGASFTNFGELTSVKILLAGVAAFIITGAGNIINDYFDSEIDRINRPHRAIPSNKIHKSDAMMLSLTLFAIGIGLSKYVNNYCLGIAVSNAIVLVIYGKYSKKMYLLSNLIVAYLVASIFVYGAFANLNGEFLQMEKFQLLAVISGSAFFSTLAREIVKDIEDVEGDRKRFSITLPIRHGAKAARKAATTFLFVAIIISAIPVLMPGKYFNTVTYAVLIIISDLIFLSSLNRHPATAQKMMIAGMTVAILAFFAGEFTTNLF